MTDQIATQNLSQPVDLVAEVRAPKTGSNCLHFARNDRPKVIVKRAFPQPGRYNNKIHPTAFCRIDPLVIASRKTSLIGRAKRQFPTGTAHRLTTLSINMKNWQP